MKFAACHITKEKILSKKPTKNVALNLVPDLLVL